jgi:hypothetical protein
MTTHAQYTVDPASDAQFCRVWSAHVDTLDRHLATDTWVLMAVAVGLIAFPIARIVIPALLHGMVPEVVRTVFHLI